MFNLQLLRVEFPDLMTLHQGTKARFRKQTGTDLAARPRSLTINQPCQAIQIQISPDYLISSYLNSGFPLVPPSLTPIARHLNL
jgi:hypothetical protein